MAEGEITISGALSAAWSILSLHWRTIWGILALNALSWTVIFAGVFAHRPELASAGIGASLATSYPLRGAVFRLSAGPESANSPAYKLGALGIQWGWMELRMFGAWALTGVFLAIILMIVTIALMAPLVGIFMSHVPPLTLAQPDDFLRGLGPDGPQVLTMVDIVLAAVFAFLAMRLFLAMPASALSGRLAVLRTWKLTHGAFWTIFVAYVVVQVPTLITWFLAIASLKGELADFTPVQTFGYAILSGILAGAASAPLNAGLQAYFYKALGPVTEPSPNGATGKP
jgi:hypothetical protein